MLAVNTTVVAVVGPDPDDAPLADVRAANVRVVRGDADAPALEKASRVWEQARRTTAPYLLHDADPLAWVADAWVRRFEGQGAVGELEVAVAETLARWKGRSLDLPDYYLVVDVERLGATLRHWFLGVLGSAAPTRVVVARQAMPVVDHLVELRPGRWWPRLDQILAGLDRVVPDQAGKLTDSADRASLVLPGATGHRPG